MVTGSAAARLSSPHPHGTVRTFGENLAQSFFSFFRANGNGNYFTAANFFGPIIAPAQVLHHPTRLKIKFKMLRCDAEAIFGNGKSIPQLTDMFDCNKIRGPSFGGFHMLESRQG